MINVRSLGLQPYAAVWDKMKQFTQTRTSGTVDEVWLLEHEPVYTQGQAGKEEHILQTSTIPIIQSDRGGQVTYHGPGQVVAYVLLDIKRRNMGVRTLVCELEQLLISLLKDFNISAETRCKAPGVYVNDKKIASIGLRVKQGCTYHGIALNVAMDLKPFSSINPCGYAQLQMTQIQDFVPDVDIAQVNKILISKFINTF